MSTHGLKRNVFYEHMLTPRMTILFTLIAKAIGFDLFDGAAENTSHHLVYFTPLSKAANVDFVLAS